MATMLITESAATIILIVMWGCLVPMRPVESVRIDGFGMDTGPDHRHGGKKDQQAAHVATR
jgi:hypothetical protein